MLTPEYSAKSLWTDMREACFLIATGTNSESGLYGITGGKFEYVDLEDEVGCHRHRVYLGRSSYPTLIRSVRPRELLLATSSIWSW